MADGSHFDSEESSYLSNGLANLTKFTTMMHSAHVRYMLSPVRLSSVCNVCAPYFAG